MANSDNPIRGANFERVAAQDFQSRGISLTRDFEIQIGIYEKKKSHKFDLGSENHKLLVECKRHTWTEGGNAPSAKLTVWNEAMYYFFLAPSKYRKVLYVLRSMNRKRSLAEYYVSRYEHLIPEGVEIWEYDPDASSSKCVYPEIGDA